MAGSRHCEYLEGISKDTPEIRILNRLKLLKNCCNDGESNVQTKGMIEFLRNKGIYDFIEEIDTKLKLIDAGPYRGKLQELWEEVSTVWETEISPLWEHGKPWRGFHKDLQLSTPMKQCGGHARSPDSIRKLIKKLNGTEAEGGMLPNLARVNSVDRPESLLAQSGSSGSVDRTLMSSLTEATNSCTTSSNAYTPRTDQQSYAATNNSTLVPDQDVREDNSSILFQECDTDLLNTSEVTVSDVFNQNILSSSLILNQITEDANLISPLQVEVKSSDSSICTLLVNKSTGDLTTQDLVTGKILPWNPYPSGNAYLCIGNFGFKPFFLSGGWCPKGAYYGNNMMLIYLMKTSGKEATYCCPKEHCPYKRTTNVTNGEGVTKNGFKAHLKHQDAHNFKEITFDKYTKIVKDIVEYPPTMFDTTLEERELYEKYGEDWDKKVNAMPEKKKVALKKEIKATLHKKGIELLNCQMNQSANESAPLDRSRSPLAMEASLNPCLAPKKHIFKRLF